MPLSAIPRQIHPGSVSEGWRPVQEVTEFF